jgi:hypothetical protein
MQIPEAGIWSEVNPTSGRVYIGAPRLLFHVERPFPRAQES